MQFSAWPDNDELVLANYNDGCHLSSEGRAGQYSGETDILTYDEVPRPY